jgi:Tfp pilus assembly protein PilO
MRASTKRMLSFVVSLALIACAIVVYAFFIAPAYDSIQSARGELVQKTKSYDEQKRVFDKIKDLNDKYKGNGTLQDAVSLALPSEVFVSQVVGDISGLANLNNRMTILSVQTELLPFKANAAWPSYIKNIGTVKATLQLRGAYTDFKSFLSQLENNYRIMDVKQISVRSDQNDRSGTSYIYDMTIFAYYQENIKATPQH